MTPAIKATVVVLAIIGVISAYLTFVVYVAINAPIWASFVVMMAPLVLSVLWAIWYCLYDSFKMDK